MSGAMLKHNATVQLAPGNNEVVIENVSPYTHANTIQAFSKSNIFSSDKKDITNIIPDFGNFGVRQ